VRDLVASVAPLDKRLRRFARTHLKPAHGPTLTFEPERDGLMKR
jgi:hypothetical protein